MLFVNTKEYSFSVSKPVLYKQLLLSYTPSNQLKCNWIFKTRPIMG
jgi:hypothetical protein